MSKTFRISALKRPPQQACTEVGEVEEGALAGYVPVIREVAHRNNQIDYVDNGLKHEVALDPDDHTPINEVEEDHDPRDCPFMDRLWNEGL